jgi:glycerol transport system permease protein
MSGKDPKPKGLVAGAAGGRAGGLQRRHPVDDRRQLLGAGDLRRQPVLLRGLKWFEQILHSERFHDALQRQLLFTGIILAIEVPLGVGIALAMPRKGVWVSVCLVLMAMPLLIPWNVVGAMWNIFALPDIGLLGKTLNSMGIDYNFTRQPVAAWVTLIAMDVWHWTSLVVLLAYAGLCAHPDAYYQAARIDGASSWAVFRYIQLPKLKRC